MSRKRKFTLIIVMLLSMSIFVTNVMGLITAVRADELGEFTEEFNDNGVPDAGGDSGQEGGYDPEEELRRQAEEAERQRQAEAEQQRRIEEEQQRMAAEAEQQRLAQEEEQRRQAEQEEIQRQAAAVAAQAEEAERLRQAEEVQRQEEERKRQEAFEKQAKEAEEAAKKQAEADAAAAEAKRLAEEEQKQIQEELEKAKQAEEDKKKQEAKDDSYAIRVQAGGGSISNIILTSTVGQGDFLIFSAVNVGSRDIDLVYGISSASDDVFAFTLVSGSSALKKGDMDKFQIAINPAAPAGDYNCTLFLKDKADTQNKYTSYITVTARVEGAPTVTNVVVSPQNIKLAKNSSYGFHAEVLGRGGDISQEVTWSIVGANDRGTYVTGDGVLVVAAGETASAVTVVAASVQNPAVSGVANVAILSNSYSVNVSADPVNGGIVTGGGAVAEGGSVTLSAVPNKNFYFDGWIRDDQKVSTATNYTINDVRSNINMKASFKQNYVTVTAIPENDHAGSVVGGGRISYGGSTTLSARAYDGFVFIGWKEGDSIISKDASITLNNLTVDRKIVAKFAKTRYTINLGCSPFEGGSVTGNGTYNLGDSVTVTAKASGGFTFQSWTVNGHVVSYSPSYKIERVDRDYNLTAVFLKTGVTTYSMVSGVATTGGTISPGGTFVAAQGSTLTYTITPKSGFAVLAVAVDGVQVGPVGTYTFENINSNHVIAAAFVQTDAGAKAAQAAGKETQPRKVQKVYKDAEPVVSENQVVSLEDAASGTAGDEYVQEMDLTDIVIPTDEELGITPEAEQPETSRVLQSLGISEDEAKTWIINGDIVPILSAAFYEGNLDAYVDNQYAPPTDFPDYHTMTREELEALPDEYINPSLPNLDKVVLSLMTQGEVLTLAEDGHANFTVSLRDADNTIDEKSKKTLDNAVGQKPIKYFDLTMMKQVNGMPVNIKELSVPLEVIIRIPDELYKEGKVYSVLRDHDGVVSVLPDLDDDPHTITFATDRFSSYAIAEQKATPKSMAVRFAIGASIALVIATLCFAILMYHHVMMRRARKKKMR
ncbi:MAG: hypothetical protein K6A71_06735 [Lachnospiraceae bacterium]|nr:hypothetical protein [Lachnospiraceae bacterium]